MSAGVLLGYDPNAVKPGWIAFFVVLILVVATFFLWRNMNKQLRKIKVPPSAEFRDQTPSPPPSQESPGDSGDPKADS